MIARLCVYMCVCVCVCVCCSLHCWLGVKRTGVTFYTWVPSQALGRLPSHRHTPARCSQDNRAVQLSTNPTVQLCRLLADKNIHFFIIIFTLYARAYTFCTCFSDYLSVRSPVDSNIYRFSQRTRRFDTDHLLQYQNIFKLIFIIYINKVVFAWGFRRLGSFLKFWIGTHLFH